MSADDPTSAEYANQQEIDRINALEAESRKAAEEDLAQKAAESKQMSQEHKEEHQQVVAEQAAAVNESNVAASQAIEALHAGEPLQDEALPEPTHPIVIPEPTPPPSVEEPPVVPPEENPS